MLTTITVEKDEIGPYLQVMTSRAGDWSQPITRVLESGLEDARQTIQGGGPDFGWAPTSLWTLKVDEAIGRARQGQLRETGGLLASFRLFEVGPTEGSAGSDSPIAKFQQEGTDKTFFFLQWLRSIGAISPEERFAAGSPGTVSQFFGGRGIIPRAFLFWREEKFDEYDRIFMDHLMAEGEGNA